MNTLPVSVQRLPNCPLPVQWIMDTTYGNILITDSNHIQINFIKPGNVMLYAEVAHPCGITKDSLLIHILTTPAAPHLGPDRQLYIFSTLKLNAGSGFADYLWNDGSVDSVLTAYNPGQYFVKATDHCGNSFSDTIQLTLAPAVPFDLGPDLQKCNNDTLVIAAPGNFSSYSWAANYNISNSKAATVQVWPVADTTYTVVAEVANGCTVTDSIRVTVKQSPVLQLAGDTSFCKGDSLVLQSPTTFDHYLWQDGSTASAFVATRPGLYWLHAKAASGCVSSDSVVIKNVYALPVQFLDAEADVCDGKTLVLNANGNWPAYHWSNNSSGPSLTINAAGRYWLQVTDAHGCTARDTIVVSTGKDCVNSIHFPNAFTPDHNGVNDNYKPVIQGLPIAFRLYIYNRFGEKVFESTTFNQGWDGRYKNTLQPSGTFVWYCVYQFGGGAQKMEKGTLVLIR